MATGRGSFHGRTSRQNAPGERTGGYARRSQSQVTEGFAGGESHRGSQAWRGGIAGPRGGDSGSSPWRSQGRGGLAEGGGGDGYSRSHGFAGGGDDGYSRSQGLRDGFAGGSSDAGYYRSQAERSGFTEGGSRGRSGFAEGGLRGRGGFTEGESRGRGGQRGRGRRGYGHRGGLGSPRLSNLDVDDNELRSSSGSERGRYRGRGGGTRGGRGRAMERVKEHVSIRSLSLGEIMELRKLHPSELVSRLSNDAKAFQRTLEQDQKLAKPGIMSVLIEILLKVAQCLERDNAQQASLILAEVLSERCSSFHLGLKQHVSALKGSSHGIQAIQPARAKAPPQPSTQAQSLCMLFQALLIALPNSSWSCLPVDELADALHQMRLRGIISGNLDAEVQGIVNLRDEIKESAIEKRQAQSCTLVVEEEWDNEEFRKEPILPKWEEICHSDPPSRLRANIITGSYTDWNHYYDIHFRLLREDFIAPLRRGVCDFMEGTRRHRLKDVKIYHHVVILEPVCTRSGICYTIQFDVSRMQHCNWEHSKRLLFGSLLCLSPDDFRNVIFFAVVSNRDPNQLKDGKLQIQIEEGKNVLQYCKKATFTMVESLVYFEASKHILHSLQTAEVDTMPFTQYLIENQCDSVCAPKYLGSQAGTVYNLNFLYTKDDLPITPAGTSYSKVPQGGSRFFASGSPDGDEYSSGSGDSSEYDTDETSSTEGTVTSYMRGISISSKKGLVNVLDPTQWPHISEVELDASQLQAIQMALTQEIAVIQGPPGTGKTYIGLKIVEALLRNRKVWDPNENSPILVMCFTNHALDQFLEGIIQNPNLDTQDHEIEEDTPVHRTLTKASIVRVGSRSKSEIVQEYSIDKKRQQVYIPRPVHEARRDCEQTRSFCADMILEAKKKCRMMSCTLVPLSELERYVDPEHLYQLIHGIRTGLRFEVQTEHVLQLWLGLAQVFEKQLQEPSQQDYMKKKHPEYVLVPYNPESCDQQHFLMALPSTATFVQEKLPREAEEDSSLSNSDDSEPEDKELSDEDDAELIDIEGEVSMEEAARMLDDEADDYRALTLQQNKDWRTIRPTRTEVEVEFHPSFRPEFRGGFGRGQPNDASYDTYCASYGQPQLVVRDVDNFNEMVQCGIKQPQMTHLDAQKVADICRLTLVDRWRLYNYWVAKAIFHLEQQNRGEFEHYNRLCTEVTEARKKCDRFTLETANIIGMTTTGAAKYQHILHLVKPKIVIVEEAAEVLESHVVSALNAGTQHLILIGDHKQLRPKPNEYNLAKKYKLDVSLFERLVRNGFPRATLQIQHRMRPQIARLVHPHIYDTLINHESVLKYEDVKGVVHNLFFLQHSFPEKEDANLISHSNPHEARYLAALCKYFLQQGYKPAQITILVTYTGQVLNMRREMPKKDFEGVRLTTVDNFQGEENDIILLSLVRSNPEENIGFLREDNRVCVALSRARMGLYCIGNFKVLRSKAPIWEKIMSDMDSKGNLGDALPLYCVNHPNTKFSAKMPSDFSENAPIGGCTKDCDYRLGCGHVCIKKCHIKDPTHTEYECRKPCIKKCLNGHPCKGLCCVPCMPCVVQVTKVIPDCGHEQVMCCCDDPFDVDCISPCPKKCQNGHACPEKCSQKCCSPCKEIVSRTIPRCGHRQYMPCHINPATFKCHADCEKKCPNGHSCSKQCYEDCGDCHVLVKKIIPECQHKVSLACHKQPIHANCFNGCERTLSCGHHCPSRCGLPCKDSSCIVEILVDLKCGHKNKVKCPDEHTPAALQCTKFCDRNLVCGHRCTNKCCEMCTVKCAVEVNKRWPCGHKFKRICYQAQDLEAYPCSKPCNKQLPCGHKCVKKCHEECTNQCKASVERKCRRGHANRVPCSSSTEPVQCSQRCDAVLACGHACEGRCHNCHITRVHTVCKYKIKLHDFCGHTITVSCTQTEKSGLGHLSPNKCKMKCPHKKCSHNCSKSCEPCTEPCPWQCPHHRCEKRCHEICDRPPCNERCTKMLKCGEHQCFGLCGEPCLKVCPFCNKKQFKKKLKHARQFNEREPLVQLDCGHIYTAEFMDDYVSSKPTLATPVAPKECPECGQALVASFRYGTAVKSYIQNANAINAVIQSQHERYLTEEDRLMLLRRLHDGREKLVHSFRPSHSHDYMELERLLSTSTGKIGPQKAFFMNLMVSFVELLSYTNTKNAPTAMESEFSLAQQFKKYLEKLVHEYSRCQLSLQSSRDLISEQYRLVLMTQYSAGYNADSATDLIAPTGELLVELAKDSSRRLTQDEYTAHSTLLEVSTSYYKYQLVHDAPVCLKGQWLSCSYGHRYSVPLCREPVREQICQQCSRSEDYSQ